jgi:hypothetical protein
VVARPCRAGREATGLEGVSPALRAWASNFSLRGQSKVTKRKATPLIRPTYVGFLRLTHLSGGTRRRAFGLRHPWLRSKSASNIPVLAPNRVEWRSPFPDLVPVPAASAPSSLMALLALPLPLGGLEGESNAVSVLSFRIKKSTHPCSVVGSQRVGFTNIPSWFHIMRAFNRYIYFSFCWSS